MCHTVVYFSFYENGFHMVAILRETFSLVCLNNNAIMIIYTIQQ